MTREKFINKYKTIPPTYHARFHYCCGMLEIYCDSVEGYASRRTFEYFVDLMEYYLINSEGRKYSGGVVTDTSKSRRIHKWLTKLAGEPMKVGKNHNYTGKMIYLWVINHEKIKQCRDAEKNKTTTKSKKNSNKVSSKRKVKTSKS